MPRRRAGDLARPHTPLHPLTSPYTPVHPVTPPLHPSHSLTHPYTPSHTSPHTLTHPYTPSHTPHTPHTPYTSQAISLDLVPGLEAQLMRAPLLPKPGLAGQDAAGWLDVVKVCACARACACAWDVHGICMACMACMACAACSMCMACAWHVQHVQHASMCMARFVAGQHLGRGHGQVGRGLRRLSAEAGQAHSGGKADHPVSQQREPAA